MNVKFKVQTWRRFVPRKMIIVTPARETIIADSNNSTIIPY